MDIFFRNFLTYDWIIFLLALANLFVFCLAKDKAKRLYDSVAPRIYVTAEDANETFDVAKKDSAYNNIYSLWHGAEFLYTLYVNFTSCFTLLGILGTVISLLKMVDGGQDYDVEFLGALTSTLWGIIFTIIYKIMDTFIARDLDMGERITELVQQKEFEKK